MATENILSGELNSIAKPLKAKRSRSRNSRAPALPPSYFSRAGAEHLLLRATNTMNQSKKLLKKQSNRLQRDLKKNVRKSPYQFLIGSISVGLFLGAFIGAYAGYKRKAMRSTT